MLFLKNGPFFLSKYKKKTYEGKDTNADTHTQSPRAITEAEMLLKDAAASLLSLIGQWLIARVRMDMHVYVCLSSRVCDCSIFFRIDRASCVGVRLCVYVFFSECSIATGSISSSNIFFSVTVSPDLTAHCVLSLHGCICFCVNKCTCKRDHVQYISVWAIWPLINSSIVSNMDPLALTVYTIKILSPSHSSINALPTRAFCSPFSLKQSRYHQNYAILTLICNALNKWQFIIFSLFYVSLKGNKSDISNIHLDTVVVLC